jgi:hypothetical protein
MRKRQKLGDRNDRDRDGMPVPKHRPASASLQANPAQVHNTMLVADIQDEIVAQIGTGDTGRLNLDGILPAHQDDHGRWIEGSVSDIR